MIILALILAGLVLGSFVNAFVWRLHEQQERELRNSTSKRKHQPKRDERNLSIMTGRSMCTHCGHELAPVDLIPVASFIWLHGKCRYCGKRIEDTPLAELLLPLVFVISYIWWPDSLAGAGVTHARVIFAFWLFFLVGFTILALYDLRWFLLPDKVVFPLIVLAAAEVLLLSAWFGGGWQAVAHAEWGVLCIAGLFYFLYVVSGHRWIGFGDVKLAVVIGLLVGGPMNALLVIFIASLLGSLVAVPMLIRGTAKATTPIPFGPLLMTGTVITVLFGAHITTWYMGLLLPR